MLGHHVTVGVSPLVRVDEATTALAVEFTRADDDAPMGGPERNWNSSNGDKLWVMACLSPPIGKPPGVIGIRLLDPAAGTVRETAQKEEIVQGGAISLDAGESDTVKQRRRRKSFRAVRSAWTRVSLIRCMCRSVRLMIRIG